MDESTFGGQVEIRDSKSDGSAANIPSLQSSQAVPVRLVHQRRADSERRAGRREREDCYCVERACSAYLPLSPYTLAVDQAVHGESFGPSVAQKYELIDR